MNDWEQELYEYALRKEGRPGIRRFGKAYVNMLPEGYDRAGQGWLDNPKEATRFKFLIGAMHQQGQSIDSIRAAVFLFFG